MSALAIPPARPAAIPAAAPGATGAPRRRGHLQLVGPDYRPHARERLDDVGAPDTAHAAAPRTAAIRLTARGRLVRSLLALTLGMLLAIGVGGWLGGLAAAGEYAGPVERVNVTAGDTLWAIAAATAGTGQDVRDLVDDIVQINGLGSAELAVGQQLLVPAG